MKETGEKKRMELPNEKKRVRGDPTQRPKKPLYSAPTAMYSILPALGPSVQYENTCN
jgi:hypothetical protein